MIKKVIFSAALLFAGSAVIAQPKVIAHRGYWTAPESAQNSLASFTKADAIGAYGSSPRSTPTSNSWPRNPTRA